MIRKVYLRILIILYTVFFCGPVFAKHEHSRHMKHYIRRILDSQTDLSDPKFFELKSENLRWVFERSKRGDFRTIDLRNAIKKSSIQNYQNRVVAERVFQARADIANKLAQLIPKLQVELNGLRTMTGVVNNSVGFLIPSRWFDFRASKAFYLSQRYAFVDFLTEQHFQAESAYLSLHMILRDFFIRRHYIRKINYFIDALSADYDARKSFMGEQEQFKFKDGIHQLSIFSSSFYSENFEMDQSIVELMESFAQFLAIDADRLQNKVRLQAIDLPSVDDLGLEQEGEYFEEILKKSYLLKSLLAMEAYTIEYRRSGIFSFFSAGRESGFSLGFNFGLDYFSQLAIDSSNINVVRVQQQEAKNRLYRSLVKIVSNHNIAIATIKALLPARLETNQLFESHLERYNRTKQYDPQSFRRGVKWAVLVEERINYALHLYLISQAELRRLRITQDYHYLASLVPQLKGLNKSRNFKKRTKRIKRFVNAHGGYFALGE